MSVLKRGLFILVSVFFFWETVCAGNGLLFKDNALFCLNKRVGSVSVYDAQTLKFLKDLRVPYELTSKSRAYPQHIWEQGGQVYVLFDWCWCVLDTQKRELGTLYAIDEQNYILGSHPALLIVNHGHKLSISLPKGRDITSIPLRTKVKGVNFNHIDYDGNRIATTFRPCLSAGFQQNPPCDHIVRLVDLERQVSGEYWLQNQRIKSVTVKGDILYLCCDQQKVYRLTGCEVNDGKDPEAQSPRESEVEDEINVVHDISQPTRVHSFTLDFVPSKIYPTGHGDFIFGRKDEKYCFYKVDFNYRRIHSPGLFDRHHLKGEIVRLLETPDGLYLTTRSEETEVCLYRADPKTGDVCLMESFSNPFLQGFYTELNPELCKVGNTLVLFEDRMNILKFFYLYPTEATLNEYLADPRYSAYVGRQKALEDAISNGWLSADLVKPLRVKPEDPRAHHIETFREKSLRVSRLSFFQAVAEGNMEAISQFGQQLEKFGDSLVIKILNDARSRTSMWKKVGSILSQISNFFDLSSEDELKYRYTRYGPVSM